MHFGHLRTVLEVQEGFGLDTVYFIPSATPPHKDVDGVAGAVHRTEMLTRAIAGTPGFCLSDVELRRPGRSYTIDTVDQMASGLDPSNECYLIVGIDAFLEIDTWKSYKLLFERISFIVMSRPPVSGENCAGQSFKGLAAFVEEKVSPGYAADPGGKTLVHPEWRPIHLYDVTPMGIAATRIRQRVRRGESIRFLVPEAVETYINEKRLYR